MGRCGVLCALKVFSYPHNWYKGTGQGVQDARNLQNDSARLRAAIERMLLESKNAESQVPDLTPF